MSAIHVVIFVKLYAVLMLLASGVLWFTFCGNIFKTTKQFNVWALFGFAAVGLLLSIFFIDGWQPIK